MIRIVLAEDHNIVRNGIRSLLEDQPWIEIVAEAINGHQVMEKIAEGLNPDVILADINMPELDGLSLTEKLKTFMPQIKVLILSMLDHEKYVVKAINAGAAGYLLKSISKEELLFAIQHTAAGNKYICSDLSMKMLARLPVHSSSFDSDQTSSAQLSKREKEVLALIAEGYTNSEISDMLFTSRRTVEGHRQKLIEKTGARNTAALIKYAVKSGIID
ncbi:response regulator [Pararcticibacter amylolyticus]|uniref:DNA-binding response regulator n=1 Tax=Pararcticibacter amylolyticus TaxID=2173175 RepID=A0A2U2PAL0_9SPHI|nr:response regulator transcription factor [Pararcticibacter amylolyticus]PWG78395.1 DNA-binding response regulator [Pararcticibacter amylolyticus]